ncbi:glycosyltransferase [Rhodosalinus sp. 5P4]|uniref:CgeB family protein n=1 Tax=Rhodosalinus sp. 5P4 TaxID=3239196 RepID=UPI0035253A31
MTGPGASRPAALPEHRPPLRILAVSAQWQGANDYALVRALRRAGHSVRAIAEAEFLPAWRAPALRALRRALRPRLVREFNAALMAEAEALRPEMLFVFKGPMVAARTLERLRAKGVICIQFFPDVSVFTHGPELPRALPCYDWVFTTKSFGLADMAERLGIRDASFLPHAFDPETHAPADLTEADRARHACDVSFIGDRSPEKQRLLAALAAACPDLDLRIWGPDRWRRAPPALRRTWQGDRVTGREYAKAIGLSKINLGLLTERQPGASSGDVMTARSFEIPAAGGFMLHQRTREATAFFEEGREAAFFDGPDELVHEVRRYLAEPEARLAIAAAGRRRVIADGHSADDRVHAIVARYRDLRARRKPCAPWT